MTVTRSVHANVHVLQARSCVSDKNQSWCLQMQNEECFKREVLMLALLPPGPCHLNPTHITLRVQLEHFCKAELHYAECHIPEHKGKNTCLAHKLNEIKAFTQMITKPAWNHPAILVFVTWFCYFRTAFMEVSHSVSACSSWWSANPTLHNHPTRTSNKLLSSNKLYCWPLTDVLQVQLYSLFLFDI